MSNGTDKSNGEKTRLIDKGDGGNIWVGNRGESHEISVKSVLPLRPGRRFKKNKKPRLEIRSDTESLKSKKSTTPTSPKEVKSTTPASLKSEKPTTPKSPKKVKLTTPASLKSEKPTTPKSPKKVKLTTPARPAGSPKHGDNIPQKKRPAPMPKAVGPNVFDFEVESFTSRKSKRPKNVFHYQVLSSSRSTSRSKPPKKSEPRSSPLKNDEK